MSEKAPDQEPSIEEILASIRQIISDDDDKPATPPAEALASAQTDAGFPPGLESLGAPEPEATRTSDLVLSGEAAEAARNSALDLSAQADTKYASDLDLSASSTDDDVLELTEMLPDDDTPSPSFADFMPPKTAAPQPESAPPSPPPRRMEIDMRDIEIAKPDNSAGAETVLTPHAASAALQGFAKLTSHMAVERNGNGITIEDIVREQLKPMLRQWLDANLPQVIEKLVQKELERLSRRVQD